MLIAQISDCHLSEPDTLTFGHVDNAAALKRVVTHVNAGTLCPDMAVISGDLTNMGSVAEARHAKSILDGLLCPYLIIPGNHDDRKVLYQVFGDTHCGLTDDGFLNFVHDLPGLRLIGLDSVNPGLSGGAFCGRRRQWLGQALTNSKGIPALIFLHHPPLPLGLPETDQDGFDGDDELAAAISGNSDVLRITAGHIHLATQAMWHSFLVTTAPSVGMELTRDFDESGAASRFVRARPGYLMHHLTKAGTLVSHVVYLPDSSETYPFKDIT